MGIDVLLDVLLADILGRLPPGSLAASRCVCKDWCAVIDARQLLRADLLPLRLDGFFCLADAFDAPPGLGYCIEEYQTVFFARPSTGRRISGNLDLLWDEKVHDSHNPWLMDHCNGLVLLYNSVVFNPATGQLVSLPEKPCFEMESYNQHEVLAYDPIVSPHYEVVLIPSISSTQLANKEAEWPPSPFRMHVFSSRKWRWEERSFAREGEAAGIVADTRKFDHWEEHHAVYWRGALYVPQLNMSIMRLTLSNDRYQIIKSPENQVLERGFAYFGKSQKGVYCVLLSNGWFRFRVWLLNESPGGMEWVLKSDISLQAMVENFPVYDYSARYSTPWIVNYEKDVDEALTKDESEWDFEGGIVLHETEDKTTTHYSEIIFLGFHPYKEIAFFLVSFWRVVSYDLNSSKIQELGILSKSVLESFPYTPCLMRAASSL